ncbi:hypothetical protein [Fundidesulfovibrio soli]|uniref:hypothetical protein n=1 Tax=Fundidesulfovibrio soli TaxID=2922716 RepID=UPI001FAF1160|nr:hypothetical protein [Fundidesulfovibrio soli]
MLKSIELKPAKSKKPHACRCSARLMKPLKKESNNTTSFPAEETPATSALPKPSPADQGSLFDFAGPTTNATVDSDTFLWNCSRRGRAFRDRVASFTNEFGENPIVRITSSFNKTDTYLTDPNNLVIIDASTGLLVDNPIIRMELFRTNLDGRNFVRRSFISKQVVAVLDGIMARNEWTPEISQDLKFNREKEDELISLLISRQIGFSFDERGIYNEVRLFGSPDALLHFANEASSKGMLFLINTIS